MTRFDILLLILFCVFSYLAWIFVSHWRENRKLSPDARMFRKLKNKKSYYGIDEFDTNKRSIIAFLICIPVVLFFLKPQYLDNAYHHPYVKSPAFVWPVGCPVKAYRWPKDNIISKNCFVDRFPDNLVKQYGLPTHGRGAHPYYRVGNDLIEVGCTVWNESGQCNISYVERDSYYQ